MAQVRFAGYKINLPRNIILRVLLGVGLIVGGFLSFLPILGIWMLPLGLIVLSVDFPPVRRFRRNITVRWGDRFRQRWPWLAQKIGFGARRKSRG